jgi:hypothetical protein
MTPPIRLRRHTDGRVAIRLPKSEWLTFRSLDFGHECVPITERSISGPGWSELLVAELPEPDYVGEASTPNWVTSDGTRIAAHRNCLVIDHDDRYDVELVHIDALKMLAAVAAFEQYRAQREATT